MQNTRILDTEHLMKDVSGQKVLLEILIFGGVNAFLLVFGVMCAVYDIDILLAPILFFFTGNTIAVTYDVNKKRSGVRAIQKGAFALLKCRAAELLMHTDDSGDVSTTSLYVRFSYCDDTKSFTWIAAPTMQNVAIGETYYVLLVLTKRGTYYPTSFYLADMERGYTDVSAALRSKLQEAPRPIDGQYAYPC